VDSMATATATAKARDPELDRSEASSRNDRRLKPGRTRPIDSGDDEPPRKSGVPPTDKETR